MCLLGKFLGMLTDASGGIGKTLLWLTDVWVILAILLNQLWYMYVSFVNP